MESIQKFLSYFIILYFLTCSAAEANQPSSGFTLNLIHRDSPLSPFYNSSSTRFDNLHNSVRRSIARRSSLRSPLDSFQSPVTAAPGEYLMKISVGTPPVDLLAVADTGSDLTWTQCTPCDECFDQGSPLFNPQNSSTYVNQPCDSDTCQLLSTSCTSDFCEYQVMYGDKSYSEGNLASETFTFGSTSAQPVVLPNITFGCGHDNGGLFKKPTTGIVGLGNGNVSIVNQLAETINGKFAYCLASQSSNGTSKIIFGSDAVVSGSGVVTTPFFTEDPSTFYYLSLESVSVGNTSFKYVIKNKHNADATTNDQGNIIIDSGTTITFLPSDFYQQVEDELQKAIPSTPIDDPTNTFSLCYKGDNGFLDTVPNITFGFTGGDLVLGPTNTIAEVTDGVFCLSIQPASDNNVIFGNLQQVDYLVGYDLEKQTVSFKQTDCSNH